MDKPKAIKAIFYNWRPVVGHKQLQLIFEVPIEETEQVLKVLGAPMPDKWCAIALMNMDASQPKEVSQPNGGLLGELQKARRPFCELPMPAQAGIKSEDLDFWLWISKTPIGNECENAADAIRAFCGVTSRKDIIPGTLAAERWKDLMRSYEERER